LQRTNRHLTFTVGLAVSLGLGAAASAQRLSSRDLLLWEPTPATARISYGDDALQFGELRLPEGEGPFPVAIVVHGGCWLSRFDITHIGRLATALAADGIATWAIEYRRFGDPGAGWPATFLDVARGADHLRVVAESHALDLDRVLAVGHSAGGQFALWLAARASLDASSDLYRPDPLAVHAVLGISPAPDLAAVQGTSMCGGAVEGLVGGSPEQYPTRYRDASPIEMQLLDVPQILVKGRYDMPPLHPMIDDYLARYTQAGRELELRIAEESGHFEVIDPTSSSWPLVRTAALELLGLD
jgi:acetyl esterase/lipase